MKTGYSQDLTDVLAKDLMHPYAVPVKNEILGKDLMLQLLFGLYSGWPVVDERNELIGVVREMDVPRRTDSRTGSHPDEDRSHHEGSASQRERGRSAHGGVRDTVNRESSPNAGGVRSSVHRP